MKIVKRKTILLITFGILFTLSLLISNNLNYNAGNSDKITDNNNLKISKISGKIHIDNNWSYTEGNYSWCTGKGTYSEPYVIEDLVIDGGGSGSGILIENSNVFFRIENCTVYNSFRGIKLERASNGSIIENNCSNNNVIGIYLTNSCYNNTISRNIISSIILGSFCCSNTIWDNIIYGGGGPGIGVGGSNNNIKGNNISDCKYGIHLLYSNNNTISGNTANHNKEYGIYLEDLCNNNTISNNTANYNEEYGIYLEDRCNNNIISGNTANYNNNYGIYLYYCDNLTISGNTANNNTRGINFEYSSYNNVSGNTANYNGFSGIFLHGCDKNNISGNTANYNTYGIHLVECHNSTILENIMDECGLVIYGSIEYLNSHNIDTSNLVNGKPLYYYTNEINLGPSNFTNAGQVILVNCTDSFVSNLNVSYGSVGISLCYCNDNTISGNTANHNKGYGIYLSRDSNYNTISNNTANYNEGGIFLWESDFNTISGNTLIGNQKCWEEVDCDENIFENNDCGYFRPAIPGYSLIFLLGILSVIVSILISKKIKQLGKLN
ncbi:MAG: right-handed parallel beta-helix repeat-containing protein [Candidatus Lokiarchaeia archaeon]